MKRFYRIVLLFALLGFLSQSYSQWQQHIIDPFIDRPAVVDVGDLDGDGDLDVAVTSWGDGHVSWYRNNSLEDTWTEFQIDGNMPSIVGLVIKDINGDDTLDIVVAAGGSTDAVIWYENDGGLSTINWIEHYIDSDFDGGNCVYVEDVDGDSDMDVAVTGYTSNKVVWYENEGGTPIAWNKHIIDPYLGGASTCLIADIDGDDNIDVFACGISADSVVWYKNNGGMPITWTRLTIDSVLDGANSLDIADIDDDLDLDVVATGSDANVVIWYENIGGLPIIWNRHTIDSSLNTPGPGISAVEIADVDLDLDLDVLVIGRNDNDAVWYENPTWDKHFIDSNLPQPNSIKAADMDYDGDPDAILTGWEPTNKVFWYENPFSGWTCMQRGTGIRLRAVSLADSITGTVVGEAGIIRRTTDGGVTWINQSSTTTNELSGVFFTDANIGTAVGETGTILRTTNGGSSWENQESNTTYHLNGVFFTNTDTGITVGNAGTILRTTNGGLNWEVQLSGTGNDLWGINFIDSVTGTVVGNAGTILGTTDGGLNWNNLPSISDLTLKDVFFTYANFGIVVGGSWSRLETYGQILRTTNDGLTWEDVSPSFHINGCQGVFFTDANTGTVITGGGEIGDEEFGQILGTTDGGATWVSQLGGAFLPVFYDVSFANENIGMVVGEGSIFKTTTGGVITTIKENQQIDVKIPRKYILEQNYPNPFNPSSNIRYSIPQTSYVVIKIYDILGREIETIVKEYKPVGTYEVEFNARGLSSGIYFYRIKAGSFVETKKMVLMK